MDEKEYIKVYNYIYENPDKWQEDELYTETQEKKAHDYQSCALLNFLIQFGKFLRIKKVIQTDSQSVAKHFDCNDPGILAFSV